MVVVDGITNVAASPLVISGGKDGSIMAHDVRMGNAHSSASRGHYSGGDGRLWSQGTNCLWLLQQAHASEFSPEVLPNHMGRSAVT